MPKDATKNIDRYKIRGGQLNEFEYSQHQEDFADTKPTKAAKGTKRATPNSIRGASAKKLAARKAAKK